MSHGNVLFNLNEYNSVIGILNFIILGSDPVCEGNISSSGLEIRIVCLISSCGNINFAKRCYSPVSSETLTFEPKKNQWKCYFQIFVQHLKLHLRFLDPNEKLQTT